MKQLILCGNGNLLQYVLQEVSRDGTRTVHSVIDDISAVISQDALEKCDILLAVSWREVENWIKPLKSMGAKNIYRIPVFAMQYKLPIIEHGFLSCAYCAKVSDNDSDLLYLETHVADTCNLKCKGCMHFSNIAVNPNFPDLLAFEQDFKRLAELFSNIFIIRLMGGEPLLNRELGSYIKIVRHYFHSAELRIVTNGLLILKQPDGLWETMRECYVSMDISPYPPTMKIIKDLLKKLDAENIPYGTIAEELHDFRKSLTLYPTHNPEEAIRLCKSSHCHFLRNGKIAKCPLPLLIDDFNHAYDCHIQSKDIFDIYGEKSGLDLKQKLTQPAEMCRYCPDKAAFITWQQTQQDACMEDWVMEEKN